ncbi:1,4-beta-D-glucan cellobiohydrolase [Drechslerella dactyloides]|uniref:1,4-beta-D-glucan cellobiohydrolase n=1 Tax=Drechslerella dactyloides TaxID=74499 RepID=A0AAD6J4G8_DREDA|nr:1,4-beta-D-glucan cellobiohydrolase [Drechslerella dactyloides]
MKTSFATLCLLSLPAAYGQVNTWGQCGGIGYGGGSSCVGGTYCSTMNPYYAQCLPGTGPTTTTARTTTPVQTTTTRTTTTSSRTTSTTSRTSTTIISTTRSTISRTTTTASPTLGGPGPGTTLISPYLWIRAVQAPYFHKYLQSQTLRSTGNAVMGDYTTAGQFNIVNGQLVQLINTAGTLLYGHVEQKTSDPNQTKLLLTWETGPSSYGTFAWSGDALTWTHPSVPRQNNAAWLICEQAHPYINLGAFAYMTPAGCADATIHFYNGATAVAK